MKTTQDGEFYITRVEHHVHKNEWCPVKSCQDFVKMTGKLPFVIATFPELEQGKDID